MENSQIKTGDIVRLLQPFRAERYSLREYTFGIVARVVTNDSTSKIPQPLWESIQSAPTYQPKIAQLVVYLYEPDSSTTYVAQFGVSSLFSFDSDEVELYKAIETAACK